MANIDFWEWVDKEIARCGSSYYAIEQGAGLGNATVSRPARNRAQPSLTVCKAIAKALDLPEVEVLQEAGLIERLEPPPATSLDDGVLHAFRSLPKRQQNAIATLLFGLAESGAAGAAPLWSARVAEEEQEYIPTHTSPHDERDELTRSELEQELRQIFEDQMEALVKRIPIGERRARLNAMVLDWVAQREREAVESRQ